MKICDQQLIRKVAKRQTDKQHNLLGAGGNKSL